MRRFVAWRSQCSSRVLILILFKFLALVVVVVVVVEIFVAPLTCIHTVASTRLAVVSRALIVFIVIVAAVAAAPYRSRLCLLPASVMAVTVAVAACVLATVVVMSVAGIIASATAQSAMHMLLHASSPALSAWVVVLARMMAVVVVMTWLARMMMMMTITITHIMEVMRGAKGEGRVRHLDALNKEGIALVALNKEEEEAKNAHSDWSDCCNGQIEFLC